MAQKPRSYVVEGYITREQLRPEELTGIHRNAPGAWVEIGTFLSWGPRSAVEKAQRQGWTREERARKYRAKLLAPTRK